MNNEPVAWMIIDVDNGKSLQFKENKFSEINIPLYTAPREIGDEEIKPLSDADIQQISHRYHYTYNPDYVGFARAIEKRHGIK